MATIMGSRMPFQSKEELSSASIMSPLGKWSVHWRWPWKPAAMALCPQLSSTKPMAASFSLPIIRSRAIMVIRMQVSSTSRCFSGLWRTSSGFLSQPMRMYSSTQDLASSNSSWS